MCDRRTRGRGRCGFSTASGLVALFLIVSLAGPSGAAMSQGAIVESSVAYNREVIRLVSIGWDGSPSNGGSYSPTISTDGRRVAFLSTATNLVSTTEFPGLNGTEHVFVSRLGSDWVATDLISRQNQEPANAGSWLPALSPDGDYVVFESDATNLDPFGDANRFKDIFIHASGGLSTWRVSVPDAGREANGDSVQPAVSAEGSFVAFASAATNLDAECTDTNGKVDDVFVQSWWGGTGTGTTCVSVNSRGELANHASHEPAISGKGGSVAFDSFATNLDLDRPDTNGHQDVFVHDMTGKTTRVSISSNGAEADGDSIEPAISDDGSIVAFRSLATNLDTAIPDTNNAWDVFVHDRGAGETTRVSINSDEVGADAGVASLAISADGRFVAFASTAANLDLITPDTNGVTDVFVHDRVTSETIRVSVNAEGQEGDGPSFSPAISGDGRYLAFSSVATNLSGVGKDLNPKADIFIRDMRPESTQGHDEPMELGDGTNRLPRASDAGFVLDSGPSTLDQYLFRDQGPIEFAIEVDRVVGRTDDQGYLLEPQQLIDKGIISPKVTLLLSAFDVDSNYSGADVSPEIDKVYVNGQYVGDLMGAEGQWLVSRLQLDVRHFKFGIPACSEYDGTNPPAGLSDCSSAPSPGQNTVRIDVDTANGDRVWAVGVDWAALSFDAARPILLVHGWRDNGESWDKVDNRYWFGFRPLLNEAGFLTAHTENHLGGESAILENANNLRYRIMSLKERYGVDKVNIVAHSKGGLDSRAYISTSWLNKENDVAVLISIASPHHGSVLAALQRSVSEFLSSATPAVQNLTEDYVNQTFNPTHPALPGVRYYSIAGDAGKTCRFGKRTWNCAANWQQVAYPGKSPLALGLAYQILNGGDSDYSGTNDFAVTVRSTQIIGDIPGHTDANTTQYTYGRNHHSIRAGLLRFAEEDTTIVDLIGSLLDVRAHAATRSTLRPTVQQAATLPAGKRSSLGLESGTVAEGQTTVQPVGVDTATEMSFVLSWDTGDLYINLIDPTGTVITPETADPNITYSEDRDDGSSNPLLLTGKWAGYGIVAPAPGLWQAQITAAAQLPDHLEDWTLLVTHDGDITASVAPDAAWKALNGTVQITSEVKAGSTPITNATVTAGIICPDRTSQSITLYDDGAHGDGAASDGVYGNAFVGSQFGIYGLSAKATGTWNGVPFSRTAVSEVQVASGTASVSGTFRDQGVDLDGDTLYDVVRIEVPVGVQSAGQFMVFGEIHNDSDVLVSTANASGEFGPGQQTLALDFDAEQIWSHGGSGQFSLSNVKLLDMSTTNLPVQIDFAARPYTTNQYRLDDFQHPAIYLTGVTRDYGVDTNNNGQFDELVVEVEIRLESGGNHSWSGQLLTEDGQEIAMYSASGNLGPGLQTIAFHFDGKAIGEKGRSGPYVVALELWGDDGFASAVDAAETGAYSHRQFESAGPSAPPVAANDRYDDAKGQPLYVGAPGVLANDILANGEPRAYYLADNQQVYEMGWYEWSWHNRHVTEDPRLPLPANNTIAAISANGVPRIYYSSSNGHIHEVSWHAEDDKWHHDLDITRRAGGPAPVPGTLTATTVNGNPRIYYLADDGHVRELAWVVDKWYRRDVTDDAGGPPAIAGSALGVTTITHDDPRLYYLAAGVDGLHVHELAWRSLTHVWCHRDVTASVGRQASHPVDRSALGKGTSPLAVTTFELSPRVYFLTSVGEEVHVCEYYWDKPSHAWYYNDISTAADETAGRTIPRPDLLSPLTATTVGSRGDQRVYYLGEYSWLYELGWSEGKWNLRDLTGDGGGVPPDPSSPLAVSAAGLLPQVYYQTHGDIHQLAWTLAEDWRDTNLMIEPGWPKAVSPGPLAATTAGRISLTAKLVSTVSHGALTLYEDGSFVYKPRVGYTGSDSFTYAASNGHADSAPVVVELDVTDQCAPVDGNAVSNFCFAQGKHPWRFYDSTHTGSFSISQKDPFAGAHSAQVTVNTPGNNIQLYQKDLALTPNTTYELSFAARSNDGQDMSVRVHKHDAPFTPYGHLYGRVHLEPYWKYFTLTFATPNLPDMNDARLRFWLAPYAKAGTVYDIDYVVLRPLGATHLTSVDGNLLKDFSFDEETSSWLFGDVTSQGDASISNKDQAHYSVSDSQPFAGTYSAEVVVDAPGSTFRLYQKDLTLAPNTTYELSFAARSNDGRDMSVDLHKGADPRISCGLLCQTINLEQQWQYFAVPFTTPDPTDMSDVHLRFSFAPFAEAGTRYYIDDVILRLLSDPLLALSAGNEVPDEDQPTMFRSYLPCVPR